MASLIKFGNGLRRIDFALTPNGKRQSVRLGRMTAKNAASVLAKIEAILADNRLSRPHDAEVAEWLSKADEWLLKRLRAAGLADGVGITQTTLGTFLGRVEASEDAKQSTRTFYGHTRRNLLDYFTAGKLLADVTPADADAWRSWLVNHEKLSAATVARRVIAARTMWRRAVRWRLAAFNPFDGVRGGTQQNEARKRFITVEMIQRVMDACPDAEWRLLVGLARFGGLRVPSEVVLLTWRDVDRNGGTLRVESPKTAHHEGHAVRMIPLFPELRQLLLDAFEAAPEGSEHVIRRYRESTQNLATQFGRIIRRTGLKPWPKLWHNLRASRESELMRQYDLTTVCRWIGNSPAVAAKHYAMSLDLAGDYRRAAGLDPEAQQKAQQSPSASADQEMPSTSACDEKPLKSKGFGDSCHTPANLDTEIEWARQNANAPRNPL